MNMVALENFEKFCDDFHHLSSTTTVARCYYYGIRVRDTNFLDQYCYVVAGVSVIRLFYHG